MNACTETFATLMHQVHDVDKLKQRLTKVWHGLGQVSSLMQSISGTNVYGRVFMS